MVLAVGMDSIVELRQKFGRVTSQEIDAADAALLQSLLGIKRLTQSFRMAGDEFPLLRLSAHRLRIELFQLMLDFRAGSFGSVDQSTVKSAELFPDR